ncbi:MAG: hypothetical protein J7K68_02095 [Candidatus Diapherotrites archaeon]|nr:hypothetical protein [Candidatus Diapherotrites archaeon]
MAYYQDEGVTKQFEAAIPILIILLLIIGVIALNPGIVRGIPVLGDLFGKPTINVLIIGESAAEANDWREYLTGDLAKKVFGNPLNIEVITDNQYNKISSADWIKSQGYDIIVLTATDLTPSLQITLKEWVQNGGKLIVVGTGGTQPNGRWAELGTVLPVSCPGNDCTGVIETVYAPTLYIQEGMFDNGLAKNVDTATPMTDANGSINVANVVVKNQHILYIGGFKSPEEVKAGQVGNIYPCVTENSKIAGGKVVYISFNPTRENITPEVKQSLIINLLAYVAGMPGYQSV